MISSVYAVLRELGLPTGHRPQQLYARLFGNLGFMVFAGADTSYQVKVSTAFPLEREFESLTTAFALLPENVAEPIALKERDGLSFMVCRGLPHKALYNIEGARLERIFVESINSFSTALNTQRSVVAATHTSRLAEIFAHFEGAPFSPLMRDWMQTLPVAALDALPHVAQHGDFAINNIGLADGRLVYFDWEDFGKIQLPGFDICIMLMSLCRFNIEKLRQRISRNDSVENRLIAHCCVATGMTVSFFYQLIPVYLLLFLYLKDVFNYGEKIMSQTISTLNAYLAAPFCAPCAVGVAR